MTGKDAILASRQTELEETGGSIGSDFDTLARVPYSNKRADQ